MRKIAILFLLISPAISFAKPAITEKTSYYSVYGIRANDIRKSINRNSNAGGFDAYTKWYIKWSYNWNRVATNCVMTNTTVSLDIKYTMPKWQDKAKAKQQVQDKWHRYYTALDKHEKGHMKFGLAAAEEIEQALLNLKASCHTIGDKAEETAHSILNKYTALEKSYDKETNHGINEGAVFP